MERSHLPVSVARGSFADLVNEVFAFGERIVLERHGKPVAALVPVADLERLDALDSASPTRLLGEVVSGVAHPSRGGETPPGAG
ncbi:MAG TPA: type II toxin-antitoxin system Phd/YefM family antitoxin [Gemmatimonadales bacterium]|nr:type II toxin-antitoxin system Phd/YefM family antitoxin [Gemmatimonadales bacterium]